jgi:aromatase
MTPAQLVEVDHEITVAAPAAVVYDLVADTVAWPQVFPPTIHVEQTQFDGTQERIRIWATAGGQVKTWTSRRQMDPRHWRIEFRQDEPAAPVAAMGGSWTIEPINPGNCTVKLRHDYRAIDDAPEGLAWIAAAVDRNSSAELAALKATAERSGDRQLSFSDQVTIDGSARQVYEFLNNAELWPRRLPHVTRVELTQDSPGLQVLRMDTTTADGTTHTTESVRVCLA